MWLPVELIHRSVTMKHYICIYINIYIQKLQLNIKNTITDEVLLFLFELQDTSHSCFTLLDDKKCPWHDVYKVNSQPWSHTQCSLSFCLCARKMAMIPFERYKITFIANKNCDAKMMIPFTLIVNHIAIANTVYLLPRCLFSNTLGVFLTHSDLWQNWLTKSPDEDPNVFEMLPLLLLVKINTLGATVCRTLQL